MGLFVRISSLSNGNLKMSAEHTSGFRAGHYRLAYTDNPANYSEPSKLLFSVDIDPAMALYDGPEFEPRKSLQQRLMAVLLEQRQIDVLIDAVRQSTKIDEDQKDCMIEGIRAFELEVPQT